MSESRAQREIVLDGQALSIADVEAVARGSVGVRLGTKARKLIEKSRGGLERAVAKGQALYGVNTGFGSFSRTRIEGSDLQTVQHNLLRSHAAGVGAPLSADVVRGMMLLLTASLCRGMSGVRTVVVEQLIALLNAGVTPLVPEIGSVGASGDLAPLAHLALPLIGEGEVLVGDQRVSAASALAAAGVEPIELQAKEGLALINGTHLMAAQGALLMHDVARLFDGALTAAAMSIDACRATDAFLDPRVYEARNQPGPALAAKRLRELIHGSQIVTSHKEDDPRVQDPYSLRCMAIILGAAWDAIGGVRRAVENELGAVTDNPLVLEGAGEVDVVSAGNFHGMPLAIPLDVLSIAVAHIAGISERRVYFMLSANDPQNPIHPHLSPQPGLHSGLMIVQYTAAACCNEIITLCTPASVSNIPTSAGIEDYNSFGPRAAAKARRVVELATRVVAIELLCAAEALEYHRPHRSGDGVERAHATIRRCVPQLISDRMPAPDIAAIALMIERGEFSGAA